MYEIYQRLLDEKGLKNADVSRETGISNMTLSDWKRGKSTPKIDKLQKIADYLNVSVDYLINGEENAIIETAKTDAALSNMNARIKEFALKLAELSEDKQALVMDLIEKLQ